MSEQKAIVTIAYHSGYGHTASLAEAVARGARTVEGVQVYVLNVDHVDEAYEGFEDGWAVLQASDAIIFGAPTYMGSASAGFKAFQDKTSKPWFTLAWKDKLAGGFTASGSYSGDKLSTLIQMAILAAQHGMNWIPLGLHPGYNSSKASITDLNRTGFFLGVGAQANADEGADVAPPEQDLKTGEHYGQRIAEAAVRWNKGSK